MNQITDTNTDAMPQELPPMAQKTVAQIENSMNAFRPDLGELITQAGKDNLHPLGVMTALGMAAASVLASMAGASNMPAAVMDQIMDGLAQEMKSAAEMTRRVIAHSVAAAGSAENYASDLSELQAQTQAANQG